jgi:hypothetical protein
MSGGKMARNVASIINRQNVCGGVKKAGLAPSVGYFLSSNPNLIRAKNTAYRDKCGPDKRFPVIQTQKRGYHAVHSGNMG